jgi:hypothetical protein
LVTFVFGPWSWSVITWVCWCWKRTIVLSINWSWYDSLCFALCQLLLVFWEFVFDNLLIKESYGNVSSVKDFTQIMNLEILLIGVNFLLQVLISF